MHKENHRIPEKPKVSIICCAFNHENTIEDALDGFIRQKTSFQYEVLVHDDASTDQTATIIKDYASQFPGIIRPIIQKENQYSKGVYISRTYIYPFVQGEYVAICEGDDYWTDSEKLQKQYEYLNKNPAINICTHAAVMTKDEKTKALIRPQETDGIIPPEEVIMGGGGFVATNSIMIRTKTLLEEPLFRRILPGDYTIQIHGSLENGMGYINQCMSVYRVFSPGSWSMRMHDNADLHVEQLMKEETMLMELNRYTEGKFTNAIDYRIKKNRFLASEMKKDYRAMLSRENREFLNMRTNKGKLRIILGYIFRSQK